MSRRSDRTREARIKEAQHLRDEDCAVEAKKVGFDLDFTFHVRPEEEALVKELRDIGIRTFWADNPFDGKVEMSDIAPIAREEYERLMAREAEIGLQKERLLEYLAPYVPAAKFWQQDSASRQISRYDMDGALNFWTSKYGGDHRQRFLVVLTLLNL